MDKLDYDWINSLGQLYAKSGSWWPVYDIEVQCGLVRIDVCGKLDILRMSDISRFKDDNGNEYPTDDFYLDGERAILAMAKRSRNKREGGYLGYYRCADDKKRVGEYAPRRHHRKGGSIWKPI